MKGLKQPGDYERKSAGGPSKGASGPAYMPQGACDPKSTRGSDGGWKKEGK